MADQKNFIQSALDHALLVTKRVRYSAGQLLGVGEFSDEQQYLLARHDTHQLFLHGYGTVAGLNVDPKEEDGDIKIMVSEGMGIDRRGRAFTVPVPQCASLRAWLMDHRDFKGSKVYVVARYDSINTDPVTLVGQMCSNESEAAETSRTTDGFRLELRAERPPMPAWDAVQAFSEALAKDDLDERARKLGLTRAALLRELYLDWVRVLLPEVLLKEVSSLESPPPARTDHSAILLAEIAFERKDSDSDITLSRLAWNQNERPYLLHTQLIQELAHGGAAAAPEVQPAALHTTPLVTITPLGPSGENNELVDFELWLHLDLGRVRSAVMRDGDLKLVPYVEMGSKAERIETGYTSLTRIAPNREVYRFSLPVRRVREPYYLRFVIPLDDNYVAIPKENIRSSLHEFMVKNNILFEGYQSGNFALDQPVVLVYVRYVPARSGMVIGPRSNPLGLEQDFGPEDES